MARRLAHRLRGARQPSFTRVVIPSAMSHPVCSLMVFIPFSLLIASPDNAILSRASCKTGLSKRLTL